MRLDLKKNKLREINYTLQNLDIKKNERVLHIGGLTGYLSVLISKLCKEICVTEKDDESLDLIKKNFKENQVTNGYAFKNNLIEKKLKFRDGTLDMIRSTISGETNVVHPDYIKDESDVKKEPTLTEKCMAIAKTRSELRKLKVECESYVDTKPDETSVIELKSPLEDEPKYLSCSDFIKDKAAEPIKPNVNLEIIQS